MGLPAHLAHAFLDSFAVVIHAIGAALERQGKDSSEACGLIAVESASGCAVVEAGGGLGTINAGAPFDNIEIELQDALFAENEFGHRDECELRALAEERAAGSEEEILDELLRDGRAAAHASTFHIVFRSELDGMPVEAVMQVEARVLGGDHGVLEIGRDLIEWNEVVALVIVRLVNPGLQTALRLHGGGGRVDPTSSNEEQSGEGPEKREPHEKPKEDGPERDLSGRRLRAGVGSVGHNSG